MAGRRHIEPTLFFIACHTIKKLAAVWPVKSRQMSIKVAQKEFAWKMKDFDKFTQIA